MKPEKIVNIHTHIHVHTDVRARVREWEKQGCVKWCALADCAFWQPPNSTYLGNDGILKYMREFPDVIVGMGSVELGVNMELPESIDRLKEQGFSGLKFEMPSHPYDDDRYMPLYERAMQLEMPILFHTGHVAPLEIADCKFRLSSEHMRPCRLDRIARAFPELKIIGSHLGLPYANESLNLLSMPNVYFDICGGGGGRKHISLIKKAMAPFPGADMQEPHENLALDHFKKMAFGTDNPGIDVWLPAAEEIMDYLRIPDATRELFYWKNAFDIFGLKE